MSQLISFTGLILRAGLLAAAVLCAGVAVAAQGGRFNWRLDALTHATPFWLIVGVLAALLAALLTPERNRGLPLSLGVIILVSGVLLMAPELLARTAKPATPGPGAIKVVQFNAWYLNRDAAKSVAWILAQDADVVILEEAKAKARPVQVELRKRYPHRTTCAGKAGCATLILSKTAPIAYGGLQTGSPEDVPLVPAAWATFASPEGPYTVAAVHLAWPTTPGALQRRQLARLDKVLDTLPKARMILAGDFNSTPWSFALRRHDKRVGLIRRTRSLASFPAQKTAPIPWLMPFPVLAIDHVYAGKGWDTVSVSRGPRLGSDHYPIVAVLTPASPAGPAGHDPGGR